MQQLLKNIITSPKIYARFLNTLSLLEYIGARKILKSQHQQYLTEKLLAHSIEELRHARVLKRAAIKIAPEYDSYAPDALLCGAEATHYFQTVDHATNTVIGEYNPWHCYLYTTLLIEIRALSFYSTCEEILQELGMPSVFRGILVEEEQHLQEVTEYLQKIPGYEKNLEILKNIEEKEFSGFLQAVERNIAVMEVL